MQESTTKFAAIIGMGTRVAFTLVIIGFTVYLVSPLPSRVPLDRMQTLWGLPLADYVAATGIAVGPGAWIGDAPYADCFPVIALAFLAALTGVAYALIIPSFVKRRQTPYAVMAVLQTALIAAAILGIF